jgi:RNA polymerase sigma factor (TIGR02999 family)
MQNPDISMSDVTHLVQAVEQGQPQAAAQLLQLVYDELRQLAAQKMARETPGQTLQATALVHEAWLRLGADQQPEWQNRAHFFAAAAEAMRRILIENARRKKALRHGGGAEHLDLDSLDLATPMDDAQLLALDAALDQFAATAPAKAELVKLRFFGGLIISETAQCVFQTRRGHGAVAG